MKLKYRCWQMILKNKHELEETQGYHNNNVILIHLVLQDVFLSGEKGLT